MARVLIVGRRRPCYRTALRLGHDVVVWSNGPLHESRKRRLAGWIEVPFETCTAGVPPAVVETARSFGVEFVVAATESSVVLAAELREALDLPGVRVQTARAAHDKVAMKNLAGRHGIPITRYHLIDSIDTPQTLIDKLGLPLVVKPVDESGATDVRVVRSAQDLTGVLAPGLLAEAFVAGPEVSVESIIVEGQPIFHNMTDYVHQWRKSIAPASLPAELTRKILAINDDVIAAFGIGEGITHAEFYLTEAGPVFGEIAARPPGGYYMELIERVYGFDPWETLIRITTREPAPTMPREQDGFAAVYMIHPGHGRVTRIEGVDEVRQLPGIFDFKLELAVGDDVADHLDTSDECGHLLLHRPTRAELLAQLELIDRTLVIDVA